MTKEIKKLYRSKTDRIVSGVCGGLAEFFGIDAIIVRVIFIILTFIDGLGILLYLVLWLLVPEKPGIPESTEQKVEIVKPQVEERKVEAVSWFEKNRTVLGAGIIAVGFFLLFNNWLSFNFMEILFWPVLIICCGLFLIFRKK